MVKKRAIRNLFSSLCSFAFGVTSTLRRALSFINPRVQGEVKEVKPAPPGSGTFHKLFSSISPFRGLEGGGGDRLTK